METSVCERAAGWRLKPVHALVLLAFGAAAPFPAMAVDLNPGGEWQVRWDNTVKYSGGVRVKSQDLSGISPNADDGNRAFDKGSMTSNRADLLSEFDAQRDGYGIRLSAAAWYDTVYNRSNDNTSAITANKYTVPYNQFTNGTEEVAGRKAEMLDWFVFGHNDIGDKKLTYRLGQHSLIWGTTMFFGANGIAKGMAPVDVYKLNIPGTQAKETTMPVPQLSSALQLTDDTSIEAYVQFKYRSTRLNPASSYLSTTDMLGDGAERMFIGNASGNRCGATTVPISQRFNNCYLNYAGMDEGNSSNNYGFALNTRSDLIDTDFGFYFTNYRDMSQVIQTNTTSGTYKLIVPTEPVRSLGMSASKVLGEANVGLEVSMRDNQPLAVKEGVVTNVDSSYVTGRTAHLNLSATTLFGATSLWGGSSLVGEFAANHVLDIDDVRTRVAGRYAVGTEKVNRDKNKTAAGVRVIFTPTWYQVTPGVDLSMPINLGWSFKGASMIDTSFPFSGSPDRAGELILGLTAVYLNKWIANISYINYMGGSMVQQPVLDRDYIRFSLQTTF